MALSSRAFFALVLALAIASSSADVGIGCAHLIGKTFFDLHRMRRSDADYKLSLPDSTNSILFNVCSNSLNSCSSSSPSVAVLKSAASCVSVGGPAAQGSWSLLDEKVPSAGLKIAYTSGDRCSTNSSHTNTITINFQCNRDITNPATATLTYSSLPSQCHHEITFPAADACPVLSGEPIIAWLLEHYYVFSALAIVLGLSLTFFGYKTFKTCAFLAGFIPLFIFSYVIAVQFILPPHDVQLWMSIVTVLVSALIGLFAGMLVLASIPVCIFGLGAWGGMVLAFLSYNLFLYRIPSSNSKVILWVALSVYAAVFGSLAVYIRKPAIKAGTALAGAYLCIRLGVSGYAGGFPNEFDVADAVSKGNYDMPYTYYIYFASIIVLAALGFFVQTRMRRKEKEEELDAYPYATLGSRSAAAGTARTGFNGYSNGSAAAGANGYNNSYNGYSNGLYTGRDRDGRDPLLPSTNWRTFGEKKKTGIRAWFSRDK
eukprot:GILI01003994.1.p1 GENE.GILI01003994.1~~GILI01003994.1.p1  ORF type:complete len:486 (+),score=124.57 GILI01003994.1:116-1573(+)